MHLPRDESILREIRRPTEASPWRVLVSACMAGECCGVDGTSYGMEGALPAFLRLPRVRPNKGALTSRREAR